jgi:hypothetical protein
MIFIADGGDDRQALPRHERDAIRPWAGLENGLGFKALPIEPSQACGSAVGYEDESILGDDSGCFWKSGQGCDVPAGLVINHFNAIAGSMGDKNAARLRIEGAMIERAGGSARYVYDANSLQ